MNLRRRSTKGKKTLRGIGSNPQPCTWPWLFLTISTNELKTHQIPNWQTTLAKNTPALNIWFQSMKNGNFVNVFAGWKMKKALEKDHQGLCLYETRDRLSIFISLITSAELTLVHFRNLPGHSLGKTSLIGQLYECFPIAVELGWIRIPDYEEVYHLPVSVQGCQHQGGALFGV